MSEACEVVAYVRSERVVVAAREVRGIRPVVATLGGPAYAALRGAVVTYGRRLPREHAEALNEARRLAQETHGSIRIVDVGWAHALARVIWIWLLGRPALPAVIVKGSCSWQHIASDRDLAAPKLARV